MSARIPGDLLKAYCMRILGKFDCSEEEAEITADVTVAADLRGVDSHGVARFPYFVERLESGMIRPRVEMPFERCAPTTSILDASNGLGQVASVRAMKACIQMARDSGVGIVAVKRSNHFGIAGYYSMMALKHDMIGIAITNAVPHVVPTFGAAKMLGTNPLSLAIPSGEERPFVLDMATSVVAAGKIEQKVRKRERIPEGWTYEGVSTVDLDERGLIGGRLSLLPLGSTPEGSSHKGYALGLAVDIISGVLSGAAFGLRLRWDLAEKEGSYNVGHFFGAMRIDCFRPLEEFKRDMDSLIRDLRAAPKNEGKERIFIPGEPEYEAEEERKHLGVPLNPLVLKTLRKLGERLSVPVGF